MLSMLLYDFSPLNGYNLSDLVADIGEYNRDDAQGVIINEYTDTFLKATYWKTGISQAVLNGNGLRSNDFVQESIKKDYYIAAMKYRYEYQKDAKEFAVIVSFKNRSLRVDIDKTYCEEDEKIYAQPFAKSDQDEILVKFQDVAFQIYNDLITKQERK